TGSRPARPPVPEHDDALPAVAGRASSKQAGSAHRRDQQGGPCIDQVRILDVVLLDQDVDGNTRLSGDLREGVPGLDDVDVSPRSLRLLVALAIGAVTLALALLGRSLIVTLCRVIPLLLLEDIGDPVAVLVRKGHSDLPVLRLGPARAFSLGALVIGARGGRGAHRRGILRGLVGGRDLHRTPSCEEEGTSGHHTRRQQRTAAITQRPHPARARSLHGTLLRGVDPRSFRLVHHVHHPCRLSCVNSVRDYPCLLLTFYS